MPPSPSKDTATQRFRNWLEGRRLARFHRRCDQLKVPSDIRRLLIRTAKATGEKLQAPDWYAGRSSRG